MDDAEEHLCRSSRMNRSITLGGEHKWQFVWMQRWIVLIFICVFIVAGGTIYYYYQIFIFIQTYQKYTDKLERIIDNAMAISNDFADPMFQERIRLIVQNMELISRFVAQPSSPLNIQIPFPWQQTTSSSNLPSP